MRILDQQSSSIIWCPMLQDKQAEEEEQKRGHSAWLHRTKEKGGSLHGR